MNKIEFLTRLKFSVVTNLYMLGNKKRLEEKIVFTTKIRRLQVYLRQNSKFESCS